MLPGDLSTLTQNVCNSIIYHFINYQTLFVILHNLLISTITIKCKVSVII